MYGSRLEGTHEDAQPVRPCERAELAHEGGHDGVALGRYEAQRRAEQGCDRVDYEDADAWVGGGRGLGLGA